MAPITSDGQVALSPIIDFIAGTAAGISGLVVGFPFDTVKVRFQNPGVDRKYHSTMHAITTIIREERFIGLYKGIMSPLAGVALMSGLIFGFYNFFLKIQLDDPHSVPTMTQIFLAGAGSGIVSSIVTTPTDLIKIRQQSLLMQTTAWEVGLQIFRENGITGLYRGLVVTALRECSYGAYFVVYEAICRFFSSPITSPDPLNLLAQADTRLSWPVLLLAGGVAGIAEWTVTFPLDVVKTRIQGSQPTLVPTVLPDAQSPTPLLRQEPLELQDVNPYRTIFSTIVHSYQTEGIQVFFKGLSPTLLRAVPVNMAAFGTYEAVRYALSWGN